MEVAYCNGDSHTIKDSFRTNEGQYTMAKRVDFPISFHNSRHNKLPKPRLTLFKSKNSSGSTHKMVLNVSRDIMLINTPHVDKLAQSDVEGSSCLKDCYATCHDVNITSTDNQAIVAQLLVGTTTGKIFFIDLPNWDSAKIFNETNFIEPCESAVTCIKWVPGSETQFLASYASGNMYLFSTIYCTKAPLNEAGVTHALSKQGSGYNIYNVVVPRGSKSSSKDIVKWELKSGLINEFAFSPDTKHLAVVSQDGFLRVFDFNKEDLVSAMRSYFGGLTCVCWSPDGRYIVTGGEDDLVTVWSLNEKRIIARGEGHRSWVTMVAFDPHTSMGIAADGTPIKREGSELPVYRFGSVGEDAHIILWDLCEDSLEPVTSWRRPATETNGDHSLSERSSSSTVSSNTLPIKGSHSRSRHYNSKVSDSSATLPHRTKLTKFRSLVKHSHSDIHLNNAGGGLLKSMQYETILDSVKVPRLYEVPRLDALVSKRVSSDRLTGIHFTPDAFLLVSADGGVQVWSRPKRQ